MSGHGRAPCTSDPISIVSHPLSTPSLVGSVLLPCEGSGWPLSLTLRLARTPSALPSALSRLPASLVPLVASVQAGPVNFIR